MFQVMAKCVNIKFDIMKNNGIPGSSKLSNRIEQFEWSSDVLSFHMFIQTS